MIDRTHNSSINDIVTTCNECKYHFYSDCYLECYKHERINNDNICKDFERSIIKHDEI